MNNNFSWDGLFSNFDLHFAQFICKLSGTDSLNLFLAVAFTTKMLREGHICCNLSEFAKKKIQTSPTDHHSLPALKDWIDDLIKYPVIGKPGAYRPLILEDTRLYLYRYWNYEQELAKLILSRAGCKNKIDNLQYSEHIKLLFNNTPDEIDWQKTATAISLLNQLTIINGGPGTGKTTTVAKILALLNMTSQKKIRVALAAPTGKAATRLSKSIESTIPFLPVNSAPQNKTLFETQTIHRLLGVIPNSPFFNHNALSPLPYDIVIIDEASMIDLALMNKLISAIPQKSRLIMLGDRDQLSSVEAGAVLGDICDTGNTHCFTNNQSGILKSLFTEYNEIGNENEPPISDCIVSLRKSYRFNEYSGIAKLSRAVNQGDINSVKHILNSSNGSDCIRKNLPSPGNLFNALQSKTSEFYLPLLSVKDPVEALDKLDTFKILCASRQGPFGVDSINNTVLSILKHSENISFEEAIYQGLPLLVNKNDYQVNLYNGDSGIIMPDPENYNQLRATFKGPAQTIRMILPRQLRSWEIAYAMTVHKSQGSEFDHVLLILPPVHIPVLSRELLYTALTRARKSVEIWCTDSIIEKTVTSQVIRQSGLRIKLWGPE